MSFADDLRRRLIPLPHAVTRQMAEFDWLLHISIFKCEPFHVEIVSQPDNRVFDGAEFFLLRQRQTLTFLLGIEILYLTLELSPRLIALADNRQMFHQINDLVYSFLYCPGKVAVGFLTFDHF